MKIIQVFCSVIIFLLLCSINYVFSQNIIPEGKLTPEPYTRFENHRFHFNLSDYGLAFDSLTEANIEMLISRIADDSSAVLNKITSKDLKKFHIQAMRNSWYAQYLQTYNGIPIDGSKIRIDIYPPGKTSSWFSSTFCIDECNTKPAITDSETIMIAIKDAKVDVTTMPDAPPELVIIPLTNFPLAWKFVINQWRYYIDASNGKILMKNNLRPRLDTGPYIPPPNIK